ncbi:hypothetical protein PPERSA_01309 [Pseudocohnilembus persalinus]|uniref:Uncharacterized protein n=1 Tax=Pseudocohnilembus persalinus TaxID=266149 RepID=A0A0V0QGU2_PSEPJ|nr:hypothetical protein PPERSA_01309 [Pseudocohnilembus persalinus]|eukprot:KRX01406.1 hypothetical protein PPERSA_01309 [Pseudocohnilembus persalinus]
MNYENPYSPFYQGNFVNASNNNQYQYKTLKKGDYPYQQAFNRISDMEYQAKREQQKDSNLENIRFYGPQIEFGHNIRNSPDCIPYYKQSNQKQTYQNIHSQQYLQQQYQNHIKYSGNTYYCIG